jgi:hypothetical protein
MTPALGEAQAARMTPGRPTDPAASVSEALRFAQTLARACAAALGQTVAGVILHGSLTLEAYVPGHSDVDLLMVVDEPLSDAQLAALTEALAGHGPRAPGPVDLRVVTRQVAASPTRRRRWRPTCGSPPPPGCGWRRAGTPASATWRWNSRSAACTAAACRAETVPTTAWTENPAGRRMS